jgi:competence protein ComGC
MTTEYTSNLPPPLPWQQRPDGLATASMVLGIVGLVTCLAPFLAIPAIVCGMIALGRISASRGALGGRSRAITGLVTGCIGLTFIPVLVLAAMLLPALNKAKEKAMMSNCFGNIKQIELACTMYAEDNQNQLPPDLATLEKNGAIPHGYLVCPADRDAKAKQESSYLYFGKGFKLDEMDATTILIAEKSRSHGPNCLIIGFGDGHVGRLSGAPGSDLSAIAKENRLKFPGQGKK